MFLLLAVPVNAEWAMTDPANTRYPGSATWNPGVDGDIPTIVDGDLQDIGAGSKTVAEIETCLATGGKQGCILRTGQTYTINSVLNIPVGKVLRGIDSTTILNGTYGSSYFIQTASGSLQGSNLTISSGATKGSDTITIVGHSFIVGDYMYIWGDDDGDFVNGGDWCDNECPGGASIHLYQMAEVTAVDGNDITIDPVIVHAFTNPTARETTLAADMGLEDLKITNANDSDGVRMTRTVNSWIYNVEFDGVPGKAALEISGGFQNTIRNNYFHQADGYGDGGQAYGIWITHSASDNLVDNNIFYELRHAMNQACAGARNVWAYNYSDLSRDANNPGWLEGDLVANHQLHPWYTLFEGNIGDKFMGDFVHGSGSHNVSFRNHMDRSNSQSDRALYAVEIQTWNYYYTVVGSVLGSVGDGGYGRVDSFNLGNNYQLVCLRTGYLGSGDNNAAGNDSKVLSTLYDHGNVLYYAGNQPGAIQYEGADDQDLPDSLYLAAIPSWWYEQGAGRPWPSIGPDVNGYLIDIPAKDRYEDEQYAGAPILSSSTIAVNGTALTLVFSENVTQGVGYNDLDWDIDASVTGNNIGITYSSGDGTGTHVYTISSTIQIDEVVDIDFNGDVDSLEDGEGNDLAAIVSASVTNNSTYEPDASPPVTSGWLPGKSTSNVPIGQDISFHVTDGGDGVDGSTIEVYVEGTAYCCSDGSCGIKTLERTGTPADYTITHTHANWDYSQQINVSIYVDDLATPPNSMDTDAYSFTTEAEPTGTSISGSISTSRE